MVWLLIASVASAGALRVTVEVGPEGPVLRHAVEVGGEAEPSDGPVEVVDADGRVLATAAIPDPRHRTLILPEGGGVGATLERGLIRVDVPWPDGADRVRLHGRDAVPRPPPPASAAPVQESGPAGERLDLVFLGDGYTDGELPDFAADVDRIVDHLLTIDPWGAYTGMFNIWRIDVASAESGISHPDLERDTAFDCYYGCVNVDRLICCDDDAVMDTVDQVLPGADGIMVLVNDDAYGGSGGFSYAVSYVGEVDGHLVAAHELGHTLVGLWDEYGYGYADTGEGPNCSADPEGDWDAWLGTDGVDAWQECSYTNLYRPTEHGCMMRTLRDDYCPVCREQAVLAMYERVPSLLTSVDPPEGTEIDAVAEEVVVTAEVVGPDEELTYEWMIDGEVVASVPALPLTCSGLSGELTLRVVDETPWVRNDPEGLLEDRAGPWQVHSETCRQPAEVQACGCRTTTGGGGAWLLTLLLLARRRR